jgi:hypothetical protein
VVRSERRGTHVRHRGICYLVSIQERLLKDADCRAAVWQTAEKALAELGLVEAQRERLRGQLARYVSPPDVGVCVD